MKLIASSSLVSRRLKITFIGLCFFAMIALQGEEPHRKLVVNHQSVIGMVERPYLEAAFSDVTFSFSEWTPSLEIESYSYQLLSIQPIDISLLDEESSTKKDSPFRVKKTINFSREIAKNRQEKLSQIFTDQSEDSLLTNPDLEKKEENKHDFLSGKIDLEIEKEKHEKTFPFAFKEKKAKSELIDRHFSHEKIEPKLVQPKEKIAKVPSVQPSTVISSTSSEKLFFPKKENLSKYAFEEDQLFISLNDPWEESQPFMFESSEAFDEKLFLVTGSFDKGMLETRTSYADNYFAHQKFGDFSYLQKEQITFSYSPVQEEVSKGFFIEKNDIALQALSQNVFVCSFDDVYIEINVPYSQFQSEKKRNLVVSNSYSSFVELPYFYNKGVSGESETIHYMPTREKATPLPSMYSLSKGPTFALELNDQVIAFAITPEFDLFVGINNIELPKKVHEFEMSALALFEPYLEMKKEVEKQSSKHLPHPENHVALALTEKEQHIDLGKTQQSTDPFVLDNEESLPIISHSLNFPQYSAEKKANELSVDDRAYLSTLIEEKEHDLLMTPSLEEIPSMLQEKSFAFDMERHDASGTFTLSKGDRLDFASSKKPELSKLELEHVPSDLNIHLKRSEFKQSQTSEGQFSREYSPSTEKSNVSLNESSIALLTPEIGSVTLPFDSAYEDRDLPLVEEQESVNKFPFDHQLALKELGVASPNVKQKDITPRREFGSELKLREDIPGFENLMGLMARGEKKYHVNVSPSLPNPSREQEIFVEMSHSFHRPSLPAYFPPLGLDSFQFETSYSAIKEEEFNHLKGKLHPSNQSLEKLELPYIVGKKVLPHKAPIIFEKSLEDLAEVEKMVELATRDENFPNSRKLLVKEPLPVPIMNETDLLTEKIASVETGMIHSQAKEILEDYDQENRFSHGLIVLETPQLEVSPKGAETKSINQSSRFTNGFLTEIPPPSHLETVTYANEFDSEIHYSKREDGKGYYFAIKLKPNEKLKFASPSQNFIFVIDGSSSIKKHRFGVFKEGVARALTYLSDGDSFNIVIADAKLRTFGEASTVWNKSSYAKAKHFLLDQDYRGFFVNYDAFDLVSRVTQYLDSNRENIVVLITDGHSFNSLKDHKDDFRGLSEANNGKFSIFTATASQGNNLSMLDLLSTFNNGELMYSKTNASFSRQLSVLVKHIESFVAKNIHINVTGSSLETGIEFYPNEKNLPCLYADRPYTIYGSINELKDFDFLLQGRAGDQWINVKQSISFKHATYASHSIKKGMALKKAYVCYDYFMKNEDSFFLSEAQKILEPFNIPTAMR